MPDKGDLPDLLSRFRGCLTGVAVGDALGAAFEGAATVAPDEWRKVADDTERLRFTDDTHMTFGVIEALLASEEFDGDNLVRIFIRDFESEPWRGYGPGPPEVFSHIKRGVRWDEAAKLLFGGHGSYGNGGAMRAAPIGLRYHRDPERAGEVARRSASITHAHRLGKEGAAVQAVAVATAVGTVPPLHPEGFIAAVLRQVRDPEMAAVVEKTASLAAARDPELAAARIGNGITAIEAVPAALTAFLANRDSFPDTVAFAVRMAGDTDTIASMAAALSGAYLGHEAIPDRWRERTEGAPSMARLGGILFEQTSYYSSR